MVDVRRYLAPAFFFDVSKSLTARRALWSLAGQILPIIAALVVVPILINSLGNGRFAALAIVWTLLGYFSLFDLGLSRSLTYRIAQLNKEGDGEAARRAAKTGLACLAGLGVFIGGLIAIAAPVLAARLSTVQIGDIGQQELARSLLLVAFGVPVVMVAAGLRGVLEGRSAFGPLNMVLIPVGIMMFVMPAMVTRISQTMEVMTATVLAVRFVGAAALALAVRRTGTIFRFPGVVDRHELRLLLGFGLWVSASAIIGPLMVYGDRFVLTALIPLFEIAYYTTPFDVITRATFIPSAIIAVFFPLLIQGYADGQHAFQRRYAQALQATALPMLAIAVGGALFALYGISWWLGTEFARHSATVALIITAGVAVNGLAVPALAAIQAAGNPSLPAKIYVVELPLYVGALWFLTDKYGIIGAAGAWSGRAALDAVILLCFARREIRMHNWHHTNTPDEKNLATATLGASDI
jgi:O-antigen/teichoic acid export membrane protein